VKSVTHLLIQAGFPPLQTSISPSSCPQRQSASLCTKHFCLDVLSPPPPRLNFVEDARALAFASAHYFDFLASSRGPSGAAFIVSSLGWQRVLSFLRLPAFTAARTRWVWSLSRDDGASPATSSLGSRTHLFSCLCRTRSSRSVRTLVPPGVSVMRHMFRDGGRSFAREAGFSQTRFTLTCAPRDHRVAGYFRFRYALMLSHLLFPWGLSSPSSAAEFCLTFLERVRSFCKGRRSGLFFFALRRVGPVVSSPFTPDEPLEIYFVSHRVALGGPPKRFILIWSLSRSLLSLPTRPVFLQDLLGQKACSPPSFFPRGSRAEAGVLHAHVHPFHLIDGGLVPFHSLIIFSPLFLFRGRQCALLVVPAVSSSRTSS